jgi:ribonuclease E
VRPVGESANRAVARPAADREPSAERVHRRAAAAWSQPEAAPDSPAVARGWQAEPVARPVLQGLAARAVDLAGWAAPIAQEAEPASLEGLAARVARPALRAELAARVAGPAWRAELAPEPALREARPVLQEAPAVPEERRAGVVSPEESAASAALLAWRGEERIAPGELVAEPALPAEEQIQAARRAVALAVAGDRRAAREPLQDGGAPGGDRTSRPALAAGPK